MEKAKIYAGGKMNDEVNVLIVEDDEGHAKLIKKNLKRSGLSNNLINFYDGQEVLDYLYSDDILNNSSKKYFLMLLDINMPKVSGVEVLEKLKNDERFCKIPIIMLTTTDDNREVDKCHKLGCNNYITKPLDYDQFVSSIKQLGLFLSIVKIPYLSKN